MKNIPSILIPLAALLLCACGATHKADTAPLPPPTFDKAEVFQLVSIQGRPLTYQPAPTLIFNPETSTIHGPMACNTYLASFSCRPANPSSARYPIQISLLSSGTLVCPDALLNADSRFLALLPRATHLAYSPSSITLFQRNKELLRFELQ